MGESTSAETAKWEQVALTLTQFGVLLDAMRELVGATPDEWEAAVVRAIEQVEQGHAEGPA